MPEKPQPLLVTLQLDPNTFDVLDQLRQHHFPPARNHLLAHITLFHALPGDELDSIRHTLQQVCAGQTVLPLNLPKPWFIGRGVAIDVDCEGLLRLRADLAQRWQSWVTPQDQQRYHPHITVQNKVPPEQARQLYDHLVNTWTPMVGQGTGLLLWRYVGGPWEPIDTMPFGVESG